MALTTNDLKALLDRVTAIVAKREQELNQADGKLGDGDTGMTLRRVSTKMSEAVNEPPADFGDFFRRGGMAASGATGSSLGSLIAFAFLNLGKTYAGRKELPVSEIPEILRNARETMAARGGAALGDKTVVDMLAALEESLRGVSDIGVMGEKAASAARETLRQFRDRPNKVGRARMFAERSTGMDDPGMLAVALVCHDLFAAQAAGTD